MADDLAANGGQATGASGATGQPVIGGAATPPASGQPAGDWTTGFNDDLKGYVQNKGFKDPQAIVESYRNFEKLQGVPQDRLLKLPESIDLSTPEGRAVFERLGAPKEAKDYKIEIPKEAGDPKLADWFREVAHKNGFTHKQVEGLIGSWNETQATARKIASEQLEQKASVAEQNLKREWGGAFEQNTNIAKGGAKALGVTKEQLDALEDSLGFDGAMKLFHKLGAATGEHEFVTGRPANGGLMTPQQAQSRINDLQKDKQFYARLKANDADAKKEWNRLHEMIAR